VELLDETKNVGLLLDEIEWPTDDLTAEDKAYINGIELYRLSVISEHCKTKLIIII
jgi:hypothetical protein